MTYSTIILEKRNHISTITLNRPEKFNTFNTAMATELNQALLELDADDDTRVIIIRGAGAGFCAGIDVSEIGGKTPLEYQEWINLMDECPKTISRIGKPVIASAHKVAVANGLGLVVASDLAIASEGTKLGAVGINIGLFCMGPAVGLSRILGRKKALELLMTGDTISAEEAARIGLINKVVPMELLEEETMKLAEKLAEKSPLALQLGKKAFYKMADLEYAKAFEVADSQFAMLCTAEDTQEGVDAFLNKRKPTWKLK